MYRSIINSEEGLLHSAVLNPMLTMGTCPDCGGSRLNPKVLTCRIDSLVEGTVVTKNIAEACALSVRRLNQWIAGIQDPLADDMKKSISQRLTALEEIGLGYLSLDRPVGTLSGGEAQRCKIAKYINSSLSDVLYILDEPSVGLHNHDIALMKDSVGKLRDHGNTVILVEHHPEMIRIADHIVDMGPGAGSEGGQIMFQGSYEELLRSDTDTGKMLSDAESRIPGFQISGFPEFQSSVTPCAVTFHLGNASLHNLKDISLDLPLGRFVVVCGVAGSGKSSLMDVFRKEYERQTGRAPVYISQRSIGSSLRSTPATYMDMAGHIRKAFAKANKVKEDYFSFNGKGACPECGGKGIIVSEMAFMDSIETVCEACHGLRYSPEALQYTLCGKNIAQVMNLSVSEATRFFTLCDQKNLNADLMNRLGYLSSVGLGYLHLNQSLSTLSGGELQRIKLAYHLASAPSDGTSQLFIIDEPTDGLHMKDVSHLLSLFHTMVHEGHSVYVIEHNIDVIRSAQWLVELGPSAGEDGGQILFQGCPQSMKDSAQSVTARYM